MNDFTLYILIYLGAGNGGAVFRRKNMY